MRYPGACSPTQTSWTPWAPTRASEQVRNVACLPGILRYSLAMPDIHFGYGFPIGGVAAVPRRGRRRVARGAWATTSTAASASWPPTSPGTTSRADRIGWSTSSSATSPSGVGSTGAIQKLPRPELQTVLVYEVPPGRWTTASATPRDLEHTEADGALPGADPDASATAPIQRGLDQVGTLGSGNHFLEIQVVDEVFDPAAARAFGLFEGQITADGPLRLARFRLPGLRGLPGRAWPPPPSRYGIDLPDRQLACAPVDRPEGQALPGAPWPARPTTPGPTAR